MDSDKQIQDLAIAFARFIPILAGTSGVKATRFLTGEVKSVDADNRVCSVEGIMDNETIIYNDVNLSPERNDGFILIPAVGSIVIIARMPDGESYVLLTSDIDKLICFIDASAKFSFSLADGFVFNDGIFGGLVKVANAVSAISSLENKLNDLLLVLGTAWVPVPNDGGAALKVLCVPPLTTPLTVTTLPDLEDTAVKH